MNILKLTLGGIFTYLGVDSLTSTDIGSASSGISAWVMLIIGVVVIFSAFSSTKKHRSSGDSSFGFSWGDSGGDGCGGDGGGGGGD